VAPTAAVNLPDFTALVDRVGPAVVNLSVVHSSRKASLDLEDMDEDSPYHEFFKRFGGMPNGPRMMPMPQQPRQGMGSGFIVSPDGYIVTNAHVVDGASEVTVKLTDRREFTAKVIGADKRTDVALIKIDAKNLPALDISAQPEVKRGEWVIAIGAPFGFENSVSAGVVSGVHRALPNGQMVPFIQTDVAVNPGNSGGPLLNARGQVVGVNSQIYSRSGGYMGLSFAIPTSVAVKVADQLKTHGKVQHGRLGIGIQGLDQTLAQSFGLDDANGAVVGSVEKDSPAAKAGFKAGDVIRKIDGVAVTDSTDVTSRIGTTAPGTTLKIEVWRDGKPVELTATVGTFDDGKVAAASDEAATKGKLGVAVRPLTPEEKKDGAKSGVVVERAGGAAAKAGIQSGDIIVGVGSQRINTVDELKSAVDKAGKTAALLIERQGRQIFVPVRIG
jgi:serine protease Do